MSATYYLSDGGVNKQQPRHHPRCLEYCAIKIKLYPVSSSNSSIMMRWLPIAALLLLSIDAAVSEVQDTAITTTTSIHHQRRIFNTNSSHIFQTKNLNLINDRFESIAQATHKAIMKIPSNDDPDFEQQLLQTSIYINGTRLTQSPTITPPTPTLSPTEEEALVQVNTIAPTNPTPTDQATVPTPTYFPLPTHLPTTSDDNVGQDDSNGQTDDGEREDACAVLNTVRKCRRKLTCAWDGTSCSTSFDGTLMPTFSPSGIPTYSPSGAFPTQVPTSEPTSTKVMPTELPTIADTIDFIPNDEENTLYPSSIPTDLPTAADTIDYIANDEEVTLYPTYSPSELSAKSSSSSSMNGTTHDNEATHVCPQLFDTSLDYKAGDNVSIKRNRRVWFVAYECRPWPESAYCNLIMPGKRDSDKGWTKLGRCYINSGTHTTPLNNGTATSDAIGGGQDQDALSSHSPVSEGSDSLPTKNDMSVIDQQMGDPVPSLPSTTSPARAPAGSSNHPDNDDQHPGPTPYPTSASPTSVTPTATSEVGNIEGGDLDADSSIRVDLPNIICDITLSSSLSEKFEQKHVLLGAMTTIIYEIFGTHLPPSLYDLAGITLSVEVVKNKDDGGTAKPTMRIHAYFTGVALFTLQGAPTRSDLITLLIRYFSVDEFNRRLIAPIKQTRGLRAPKTSIGHESVKVNSVFFTLEDGSLVSAGSIYDENMLPASSVSSPEQDENRVHVAFVLSVFVGKLCGNIPL